MLLEVPVPTVMVSEPLPTATWLCDPLPTLTESVPLPRVIELEPLPTTTASLPLPAEMGSSRCPR